MYGTFRHEVEVHAFFGVLQHASVLGQLDAKRDTQARKISRVGVPVSDIMRGMGYSRSTAKRRIFGLADKGYIEITPGANKRQGWVIKHPVFSRSASHYLSIIESMHYRLFIRHPQTNWSRFFRYLMGVPKTHAIRMFYDEGLLPTVDNIDNRIVLLHATGTGYKDPIGGTLSS